MSAPVAPTGPPHGPQAPLEWRKPVIVEIEGEEGGCSFIILASRVANALFVIKSLMPFRSSLLIKASSDRSKTKRTAAVSIKARAAR
jgi:hypothetical protein